MHIYQRENNTTNITNANDLKPNKNTKERGYLIVETETGKKIEVTWDLNDNIFEYAD